jgi:hypothetical protein
MTQPRPNADQVRRRFSASAVASALVVKFSGAGVCLGATLAASRWLEHRQLRAVSGHTTTPAGAAQFDPSRSESAHRKVPKADA